MSALALSLPGETVESANAPDVHAPETGDRPASRAPEGKARACMNTLRRGIFSGEVPLPGEDREDFESLIRECTRNFQAETERELSLVQDIVDSRWRRQRVVARETALTILTTEQQRAAVEKLFDADYETITVLAQAAGFQANSRLFHQLSTAEVRLHRRAELAGKQLTELVHARRVSSLAKPEARPEPLLAAAHSGFVPPLSPKTTLPSDMPSFTGPLKKEHRRQWLRKYGNNQMAKAAAVPRSN